MKNVTIKCILGGDDDVCKTSLVRKFTQVEFSKDYLLSGGVDVSSVYLEIDGKKCIVSVNLVTGSPRFENNRAVFFKGAAIAVICFDLINEGSFNSLIKSWISELSSQSDPDSPIQCIIVGTKSDLEDERVFTEQEARNELFHLKQDFNRLIFIDYVEINSFSNGNKIRDIFVNLSTSFLKMRGLISNES